MLEAKFSFGEGFGVEGRLEMFKCQSELEMILELTANRTDDIEHTARAAKLNIEERAKMNLP
jgi:hypothetical protein